MGTKERVAAHRARMRSRGYREVRMWVPDVRSEEFATEARRASIRMNRADAADGVMDDLEAVSWAEEHWDSESW